MNNVRLDFNVWRRALRFLSRQFPSIFLAFWALTIACASFAFGSATSDDSEDESLPRVFVLSIADYRSFDKAGLQGVKHDVETVEYFFRRNVSDKLLEYSRVDPDHATPEATIKAIKRLEGKIGKNDVVFFYYTGHGAYDAEKGGHYLMLKDDEGKGQALYRSDVKRRLFALNARLVVIFTDCCNVMSPVSDGTAYDESNGVAGTRSVKALTNYSPVVKKLFVDSATRGVVDLTSSVPGEYSYAFTDGSVATTVAIKTFEILNDELKHDSSAKVDWRRFVDEWTKETEDFSREKRKSAVKEDPTAQEKQTPHAYELPDSVRLGARVAERNGAVGLQITQIAKGSPAEKIGLKVGDFIVRIGERATVKEQDYNRIVDSEPRETTITFVRYDENDKEKDGKEQTVEIELNGTPIVEAPRENKTPPDKTPRESDESTSADDDATESSSDRAIEEHEPFVGLAITSGNKIAAVAPGSPAADAGLKAGDILGTFDGVAIYDSKDYDDAVAAAQDEAVLGIKTKDGRKMTVRLKGIRTKPRASTNGDAQGFSGIGLSHNENSSPKVMGVKKNSPAAKAGVQVGDVIRRFGGREIVVVKDYVEQLKSASDEEELVVLRNGELQTLTLVGLHSVSSSEQESQASAQSDVGDKPKRKAPVFGAGLSESQENEIVEVVDGSPADKAGLHKGDKLLKFDGKTIQSRDDFIEAVDAAESAGRKTVEVEYETSGRRFTKEVELNID